MVTAVGPGVTSLSVGDRVALEVGLPCRTCALCLQGRYNICRSIRFRSSAKTFPHLDGTLTQFMNHPASMCHKLPDSVSDIQGALIEPLSVCLHAIHRSNPPSKERIEFINKSANEETAALIFGAGAIGLLLASALAATQSFSTLVIADIDPLRLSIAAKLPFDNVRTFQISKQQQQPAVENSSQSSSNQTQAQIDDNAARYLAQSLQNKFSLDHGYARVYDCTGVAACVRAGIYASSPGGALVQIGMGGASSPTIPLAAAALREVDLLGVFRYDGRCYPEAVNLIAGGALTGVEELVVTHTVKMEEEEGKRAFRLAGSGVDETGKAVVKVVVMGG